MAARRGERHHIAVPLQPHIDRDFQNGSTRTGTVAFAMHDPHAAPSGAAVEFDELGKSVAGRGLTEPVQIQIVFNRVEPAAQAAHHLGAYARPPKRQRVGSADEFFRAPRHREAAAGARQYRRRREVKTRYAAACAVSAGPRREAAARAASHRAPRRGTRTRRRHAPSRESLRWGRGLTMGKLNRYPGLRRYSIVRKAQPAIIRLVCKLW